MIKLAKSVAFLALAVTTLGSIAPASANSFIDSDPGCRRIITNVGGPDQPRAVSGLDNNQVPVYSDPSDVYGGTPTNVKSLGSKVILAYPQEKQLAVNPSDMNQGTFMIAVRDDNGAKVWMPLSDARPAGGAGQGVALGQSNLGYCSVQGMW